MGKYKRYGEKMILDDIKNFLVENAQIPEDSIKYDFDSSKGDDIVLLSLYDSVPCDLAMRSGIKITIKYSDLKLSRDMCFLIHSLLFPEDLFQKSVIINGKRMHVKLIKGPFYQGKDQSKRHNYILDFTITYNR